MLALEISMGRFSLEKGGEGVLEGGVEEMKVHDLPANVMVDEIADPADTVELLDIFVPVDTTW